MALALELLFVLLVSSDTILTYQVLSCKKGVEIGFGARKYIQAKTGVWFLNALLIVVLLGWLRFAKMQWFLIPVDIYMVRRVYFNWRVLNE